MNVPKLRFKADTGSELQEWEKYRFLELIDNIIDLRGRTPKKLGMDWAANKTEHLALSAVNVKMGYIDFDVDPHYGDDDLYTKWMAGHELHKGNVLFTTEAPMGNVAQVPDHRPYILSQRTIVFIPKINLISEDFLAKLLESPSVQSKLKILATGGTAQGVSQKSLMDLIIKIPTSDLEQQKIAIFFSVLDYIITSTELELNAWEKQKRGIMQLLFSRKVRFKADDGSEFPEWRGKTLGDVSCITMGQSPDSSSYNDAGDGVLLVQGNADIQDKKTTPTRWTSKPTKFADSGDIIMSVRAPVGTIGIATTRVCCGRGVCAIKANVNTSQSYLYQYLVSIEKKWDKEAQGGTFTAISGNDIRARKVPVPCLAEQQKIAACLSAFDDVIDKTKEELEAYRELKKGLLQQMFV